MKEGKIAQKSLAEKTADAIINKLHVENYKVGAKLPSEVHLAEYFEVSRTTIREAIKILRDQGIVRTEHGSGTFVADFQISDIIHDPLGLSLIYDQKKMILDLLDLRLLIEPKCASLATQNANRTDIQLIMKICDEFDELVDNHQNYVKKDMEFHQAIANCNGNLVLHNLIPYIHQMQILTDRATPTHRAKQTAKEHRMIAEAIRDHRGIDAYDLMLFHISIIRQRFLENQ